MQIQEPSAKIQEPVPMQKTQVQKSGFKRLEIWKKGMDIAKQTYCATDCFPASEKYGLVSQMRRSAVSVPSNIAEGYSRRNDKEFKQFLYIALGSLSELETQILISKDIGIYSDFEILLNDVHHERHMILKLCHHK